MITIKRVESDKDMNDFIRLNYELYKGNPYSVPDLAMDLKQTFSARKNAAYRFCESQCFLALDGNGRVVGRVAAIINHKANEAWGNKRVRFGWIDFVDDESVSKALLDAVEQWGRERGMTEIHGPLGFTDFDPEGMLVDGFDKISTMATIYNYPYYPKHIELLGYEKDADWVEFKINIPDGIPDKMKRIADLISRKYGLHIRKLKNMKEVREGNYGKKIFDLVNEAYASLYGFSPLDEKQIDQYVDTYLPLLDLRMVTLVEDEADNLVAVGVSMPSVAKALQKAKGKLFPFGWYHLLKALKFGRSETLELMIVGVKEEFRNKGVNSLLFVDLIPTYISMGFKDAESNPELEINDRVQAQWEYFDTVQHKRRRAYKKNL